jgi:plastocyanin
VTWVGEHSSSVWKAAVALAIAAVLALGAQSGVESAGAAKKTVNVEVGDDYFSPDELKVKKGTKIKWKWRSDNGNPHNATLDKGPKGVKKGDFSSKTATISYKFAKVLKKPGTYEYLCTIHPTVMTQTIKVKK